MTTGAIDIASTSVPELSDFQLNWLQSHEPDDVAATKTRLLVAAVKLFADRGYEASSMRELAAEVGVKAPAIYNHFESKTDVLTMAVDYALSDFLQTVLTGIDELPPAEQLFEILRRHARYKTADVSLARAQDRLVDADFLRRVLPSADYERFTAALVGYRAIVRAKLLVAAPSVASDPSVNVAVVVSAMLEVCDQVSSWFRPDGRLTGDQIADQCVVLVRRMVTPQA